MNVEFCGDNSGRSKCAVSVVSFPAKNIIMLIYFVSISRDFEFCQIVSLPRNFKLFLASLHLRIFLLC